LNRRRIYVPEQEDSKAWRIVSTIIVFVLVFVVCAALSIDDVEQSPPRTLNPWEMTEP
jgi:hypothetical protein